MKSFFFGPKQSEWFHWWRQWLDGKAP